MKKTTKHLPLYEFIRYSSLHTTLLQEAATNRAKQEIENSVNKSLKDDSNKIEISNKLIQGLEEIESRYKFPDIWKYVPFCNKIIMYELDVMAKVEDSVAFSLDILSNLPLVVAMNASSSPELHNKLKQLFGSTTDNKLDINSIAITDSIAGHLLLLGENYPEVLKAESFTDMVKLLNSQYTFQRDTFDSIRTEVESFLTNKQNANYRVIADTNDGWQLVKPDSKIDYMILGYGTKLCTSVPNLSTGVLETRLGKASLAKITSAKALIEALRNSVNEYTNDFVVLYNGELQYQLGMPIDFAGIKAGSMFCNNKDDVYIVEDGILIDDENQITVEMQEGQLKQIKELYDVCLNKTAFSYDSDDNVMRCYLRSMPVYYPNTTTSNGLSLDESTGEATISLGSFWNQMADESTSQDNFGDINTGKHVSRRISDLRKRVLDWVGMLSEDSDLSSTRLVLKDPKLTSDDVSNIINFTYHYDKGERPLFCGRLNNDLPEPIKKLICQVDPTLHNDGELVADISDVAWKVLTAYQPILDYVNAAEQYPNTDNEDVLWDMERQIVARFKTLWDLIYRVDSDLSNEEVYFYDHISTITERCKTFDQLITALTNSIKYDIKVIDADKNQFRFKLDNDSN